jgi:hypothetical protein
LEQEDVKADLLSTSAGLGEARDTGASRRPWTTVRFHEEKRERPTVGKKEGGPGIEEREEGKAWRR